MSNKAYPLDWPIGWKRTERRRDGGFRVGGGKIGASGRRVEIDDAVARVYDTLALMGVKEDSVTISTNIRPSLGSRAGSIQVKDPGVTVYWTDKQARPRCMAIDQYIRVPDNLAAVAATLEAMRAIERHGGAEILDRAFTGFTALPAPQQWFHVLGVKPDASESEIRSAYRTLVSKHHPDRGGDPERMAEINRANDQAMEQF